MKHVFAYIRVSTVRQGEKGSSLQEQRSAIDAYAKRNGVEILQWFVEMETAAKRGRRAFTRMLAALERGAADGVILHKIDRGARNLWDWASLQGLVDRGIEVHLAHEALDLNSRGGRLSADIQAVVAADYIRNLRDEVRKGIYGRLNQGLYPFRAPLGYLDMGKGKPKAFDPRVGPLVRQAFELYASGSYSLIALLAELHQRGFRNRHGGAVSKNGLAKILRNPFYMGVIYIKRRGATYEGVHDPLISKPLFDRVQAVLDGKAQDKLVTHHFLFGRFITCAGCGRSLSGERQKAHTYYRCHLPTCCGTSVREDAVDRAVRAALALVRFSDEEITQLRSLVRELKADWNVKREEREAAVRLCLGQLDARLDRLTDAYIDRMIDQDAFDRRKSAFLYERKGYQEQLRHLAAEDQRIPEQVAEFFELAHSALLSYETGNDAGKREILKSTTSNFLVEKKSVVVELRKPFLEVAKCHAVTDGGP